MISLSMEPKKISDNNYRDYFVLVKLQLDYNICDFATEQLFWIKGPMIRLHVISFFFLTITFLITWLKIQQQKNVPCYIELPPAPGCSSWNNTSYTGHAGVTVNRFRQRSTPWGIALFSGGAVRDGMLSITSVLLMIGVMQ